jgi:hypothetical protein
VCERHAEQGRVRFYLRDLCMWGECDEVHDLNWRLEVKRIACRDKTKYKGRREVKHRS